MSSRLLAASASNCSPCAPTDLPFSYYIYYHVGQPDRARDLVRSIQASVVEQSGIAGRFLTKRDDPATWMEIYEGVTDTAALEACLAGCVKAANFASVVADGGTRHIECFEEPCA